MIIKNLMIEEYGHNWNSNYHKCKINLNKIEIQIK